METENKEILQENQQNETITEEVKEEVVENPFKELEGLEKEQLIEKLKSEILRANELEKSLVEASAESLKNKENWLRTAADFENFKKRMQDTRINAYKDGKIEAIKNILVVGDNLDRALLLDLDQKTREGIELTLRRFEEILSSMDVTSINPVGEEFNPNTMEAIMTAPLEEGATENTVKQVFLKGYKLGDRVLRYAQVVVYAC